MSGRFGDFQSELEAAAKNFAGSVGTSLKWVDYLGKGSRFDKYRGSKYHPLQIVASNPLYGDPVYSDDSQDLIHQKFFNYGDSAGSMTFMHQQTRTQTVGFSMSEGISFSNSQSFSVDAKAELFGVGGGASTTMTISTTIDVSSTQTSTKSEAVTLRVDVTKDLPPNKVGEMTWVINNSHYTMPFTVKMTLVDQVAVWLNHKKNIYDPSSGHDQHYLWFLQVGHVLSHSTSGRFNVMGPQATFTARGSIDARYATDGNVTARILGDASPSDPKGATDVFTTQKTVAYKDRRPFNAVPAEDAEAVFQDG